MDNETKFFEMRAPCKSCQTVTGIITTKNGQDTVRCSDCGAWQYNAPKDETGKAERNPNKREPLKDAQRARIYNRDGAICSICGNHDKGTVFHVAHILSVSDIRQIKQAYGLDLSKYEDDDRNLFVCCESCNLGQGKMSLMPKLAVTIACLLERRYEKLDSQPNKHA